MVDFQGRSIVHRPYMSGYSWSCQVPRAPLHEQRCYLARRDLLDPVSRRYSAFIALTGSCANPQPSSCLGVTLEHKVFAGCCQPLLGGGPSRRSLCESLSACLDPYPGCSCGALTRFFPQDNGLRDVRNRSAPGNTRTATSVRSAISRLQSFTYVQARRFACHPDCSYHSVFQH